VKVIIVVKVLVKNLSLVKVNKLKLVRIKAKVNCFKALRILSVLNKRDRLIYS
jgi:hypothetical protein